jgi:hypothetical protein
MVDDFFYEFLGQLDGHGESQARTTVTGALVAFMENSVTP